MRWSVSDTSFCGSCSLTLPHNLVHFVTWPTSQNSQHYLLQVTYRTSVIDWVDGLGFQLLGAIANVQHLTPSSSISPFSVELLGLLHNNDLLVTVMEADGLRTMEFAEVGQLIFVTLANNPLKHWRNCMSKNHKAIHKRRKHCDSENCFH